LANLRQSREMGQARPEDNTLLPDPIKGAGRLEPLLLDDADDARWCLRAAKQGEADAQYIIGGCYHLGLGVPDDYVEAYKWANLASAQNIVKAQELRAKLVELMTPEMIGEAQRRASVFVAKKEGTALEGGDFTPSPEIVEGKMFAGTGFFVTDDGYLVTCQHVVHGAISFHVKTASGSIRATLVTNDAGLDIALLKVSGSYPALPLDTEAQVKLGDSVFTIGFPNTDLQGVAPKLTRGEISSLSGIRDNPRYFQISVPVQPGNSGGALVDERGNVVGVVTSRLDDAATYEASGALPQNVNYAVKGDLVYNFLNKVPELSGKLKAPRTVKDPGAATAAAERSAVLVIAE
jgi:S1-C subfamily serine protease